ncbi:hypothetical protein ESB00_07745 [Oleiharenicola lentus]|uniref:Uncharacterized protein n=1 Tax=Oleiharenicola lentus TaxID=2508720 RepID=A0A4Q1C9W7_9BACT|nr:hypothetical protein [Oleiharenicola lentus]RXK55768.1 hypothetical protein ESB00_07745 [Oleiharenicola lentus]
MSRLSALPLVCFLVLFAYGCYGTVVVGHWPYYAHPDPKELPLRPLSYAVALTSLAGILAVLALPIAYTVARGIAAWRKQPLTLRHGTLPLYFMGSALWVADFVVMKSGGPWHSLLSWIMD